MNAQTPITTAPKPARKRQIRAELSAAIDLIAYQGLRQADAARRAGIHEVTLCRALKKPHVHAELEQRKIQAAMGLDTLKGIAQVAAYRVGIDLMHNSADEKIRAKMVELFTGEARNQSVAVQVNVGPNAGYTYARPDTKSEAGSGQVIDGKAKDVTPE